MEKRENNSNSKKSPLGDLGVKSVFMLALLFSVSVAAQAQTEKKKTVTFNVEMHCISCQQKIERNLAYEKGVLDLKVSYKESTVIVTFNPAKTDEKQLMEALKKLGYEVTLKE